MFLGQAAWALSRMAVARGAEWKLKDAMVMMAATMTASGACSSPRTIPCPPSPPQPLPPPPPGWIHLPQATQPHPLTHVPPPLHHKPPLPPQFPRPGTQPIAPLRLRLCVQEPTLGALVLFRSSSRGSPSKLSSATRPRLAGLDTLLTTIMDHGLLRLLWRHGTTLGGRGLAGTNNLALRTGFHMTVTIATESMSVVTL